MNLFQLRRTVFKYHSYGQITLLACLNMYFKNELLFLHQLSVFFQ